MKLHISLNTNSNFIVNSYIAKSLQKYISRVNQISPTTFSHVRHGGQKETKMARTLPMSPKRALSSHFYHKSTYLFLHAPYSLYHSSVWSLAHIIGHISQSLSLSATADNKLEQDSLRSSLEKFLSNL